MTPDRKSQISMQSSNSIPESSSLRILIHQMAGSSSQQPTPDQKDEIYWRATKHCHPSGCKHMDIGRIVTLKNRPLWASLTPTQQEYYANQAEKDPNFCINIWVDTRNPKNNKKNSVLPPYKIQAEPVCSIATCPSTTSVPELAIVSDNKDDNVSSRRAAPLSNAGIVRKALPEWTALSQGEWIKDWMQYPYTFDDRTRSRTGNADDEGYFLGLGCDGG
ncbi:hypothetical protein M501DRAFT_1060588 [Patellaria atrata CBS 101060]|uniref:Uncharacterized protein n=1 Tax=Patellaria atrata CBS 101060 TaxID=1346257 RepID=A0A9P4S3L6_9PEZI|nr:hypothetical protein M501DRAFT_1060588 [Patellaria atrata CBS 101060]